MLRTHLIALSLLAGACATTSDTSTDDTSDTGDTNTPSAAVSVVGVWATEGDPHPLAWLAKLVEGGSATVDHVVFEGTRAKGGVLRVYAVDTSGQLFCESTVWSPVTAGSILVADLTGRAATPRLLLMAFDGDDTLRLTREDGATATLSRADAVPEDLVCLTAALADDVVVEQAPSSRANLVWDGTNLRWTSDDDELTYAVDKTTGALSAPWSPGFSDPIYPLVAQDGSPWNTCFCGHNETIEHIQTTGGLIDEVDTEALGIELNVRAATVDGTGDLWLHGPLIDGGARRFLEIKTAGEPDVLSAAVPTTLVARAITQLDGTFYALVGAHSVVRFDPTNGTVDATWGVDELGPDEVLRGITSDGAVLWVAIEGGDGVHRLATLEL